MKCQFYFRNNWVFVFLFSSFVCCQIGSLRPFSLFFSDQIDGQIKARKRTKMIDGEQARESKTEVGDDALHLRLRSAIEQIVSGDRVTKIPNWCSPEDSNAALVLVRYHFYLPAAGSAPDEESTERCDDEKKRTI